MEFHPNYFGRNSLNLRTLAARIERECTRRREIALCFFGTGAGQNCSRPTKTVAGTWLELPYLQSVTWMCATRTRPKCTSVGRSG